MADKDKRPGRSDSDEEDYHSSATAKIVEEHKSRSRSLIRNREDPSSTSDSVEEPLEEERISRSSSREASTTSSEEEARKAVPDTGLKCTCIGTNVPGSSTDTRKCPACLRLASTIRLPARDAPSGVPDPYSSSSRDSSNDEGSAACPDTGFPDVPRVFLRGASSDSDDQCHSYTVAPPPSPFDVASNKADEPLPGNRGARRPQTLTTEDNINRIVRGMSAAVPSATQGLISPSPFSPVSPDSSVGSEGTVAPGGPTFFSFVEMSNPNITTERLKEILDSIQLPTPLSPMSPDPMSTDSSGGEEPVPEEPFVPQQPEENPGYEADVEQEPQSAQRGKRQMGAEGGPSDSDTEFDRSPRKKLATDK